jgi:hypothetical protein
LWCQGDDIKLSDRDEPVAGVSGGKTAKRPRGETCGKGGSEEASKPPRTESPTREPAGNLHEVNTPGVAPAQAEISREGRERKATKADDAEVPEYLWHEHVFEDCGRSWMDSQKKVLPRAAKVLQKGMLKHWKQRVLTSYLTWLNKKHNTLATLDKRYAKCIERRDGKWPFVEAKESDSPEEKRTQGLAGYQE